MSLFRDGRFRDSIQKNRERDANDRVGERGWLEEEEVEAVEKKDLEGKGERREKRRER